jgi:hypothetical protein
LPLAKEVNDEVALKFASEYLREKVNVAHQGGEQDDWDVASVEQLNRVRSSVATHTL